MGNESSLSDTLALVNALSSGREKDKEFKEVMSDVCTALTDIVELLEHGKKNDAATMAEALSAAMKTALKDLPAPNVNVPASAVHVEAAKPWSRCVATPEYDVNGRLKHFTFVRT